MASPIPAYVQSDFLCDSLAEGAEKEKCFMSFGGTSSPREAPVTMIVWGAIAKKLAILIIASRPCSYGFVSCYILVHFISCGLSIFVKS